MVSLVGAGGKTSLMFALALEAAQRWGPERVLVTTTTRIYEPSPRDLPPLGRPAARFPDRPTLGTFLTGSLAHAAAAAGRGALLVLGTQLLPAASTKGASRGSERRKVEGVPPEWVDQLGRSLPGLLVLVEADGAAGHPLKAPAEHEPVLPGSTSLVLAVAGIDAVG